MAGCVQASKMFFKLFSLTWKDRKQTTIFFLFEREWGFLFGQEIEIINRDLIGKGNIEAVEFAWPDRRQHIYSKSIPSPITNDKHSYVSKH